MLFQELYPAPSTLRTTKQPTGEIELYTRVERHPSAPLFTLQVCQSVLLFLFPTRLTHQGMAELRGLRLPEQRCRGRSTDRASCADAN